MTNNECPDGSGPINSIANSCQGPSANDVDRIGSGGSPADTRGTLGNVSQPPYPSLATTPWF